MGGFFIALALVSAVFFLLERKWPALQTAYGRPWRRPGFWTDAAYWLFTPLVTRVVTRVTLIVALVVAALLLGAPRSADGLREFIESSPTWASSLPLPLQVVLVFVLADFFGYWQHRLFHRGWFWKLHAVHHSSRALTWISAVREHPLNDALAKVMSVVPLFIIGFRPGVVAAYVPLLTLYALLLHANVSWSYGPLRYVLASPAFHRWHHTAEDEGLDRNFAGLFPIWDLLFGTFHMPRTATGELRQATRFGVNEPMPESILGQLAYPFRR